MCLPLCHTIGISVTKEKIHFSGFYSQGDGSTFEADVNILQFVNAIEAEAWQEYALKGELPVLPFKLDRRIEALLKNGTISSYCVVRSPLRGYWTNIDVCFEYSNNQCKEYRLIENHLDSLKKWLEDTIETINLYLYKSLEEEYEYQTSDEAVVEVIRSNGYHFTVDGKDAEWLLAIDTISAV